MSEVADLLERFRRGAELVAVATTGAAGPVLDFRPAEGKWGVRTIVCHLSVAIPRKFCRCGCGGSLPRIIRAAGHRSRRLGRNVWTYSKRKNFTGTGNLPPGSARRTAETAKGTAEEETFARTGQHGKREGSRCSICSAYSLSIPKSTCSRFTPHVPPSRNSRRRKLHRRPAARVTTG